MVNASKSCSWEVTNMDSQELYEVLFDAVMSCDDWPQELSEKSDTVIGAYEMLGHYLVGRAMELKGDE